MGSKTFHHHGILYERNGFRAGKHNRGRFHRSNQQERGYAYQHFVLGLLESGNCVGWHWFRYQDNDPTAKGADPSNLDSNKGLVDNEYNLYKPLADAMKELNINAYRLADWFDQQSTNNK